jgi:Zn-dependent peptidase ImmA (M78 family)/DNA-binding XRE family transcriptional regulator
MNKNINSEMVILARKSRGLTQEELANLTGISQGHLSKYEARGHEVPEDQLAKIAEAVKYPESFFFQKEESIGLGPSILYHRKRQQLGQKKLQQIEAIVNVLSLQLRVLLAKCEIDSENEFPRYDIEDHNHNATRIAQLVRAQWRLPMGPIKNIVRVIENAGGVVMNCDFGTKDFDGLGLAGESNRPFFFTNKNIPTDRLRFTLAHEIGHIVMHRANLSPEIEEEANLFASEFLMPADEIREELKPFSLEKAARLKIEWKVSIAALGRRAKDLGMISESQYKRFCTYISALGYRTKEPISLSEEKPSIPKTLVETLQKELKQSYQEMAKMANCYLSEFLVNYLGAPGINIFGARI